MLLGHRDGTIEAVTHPGAGQRPASPVGEHGRVGSWRGSLQPATQVAGGGLPQRYDAFFAAFAVQVDGGLPVQQHIAYA